MQMKPPEHVQELLDAGTITEAQWHLFRLADEGCRKGCGAVLHVGGQKIEAGSVGLDVTFPGVIFLDGPEVGLVHLHWASLSGVEEL